MVPSGADEVQWSGQHADYVLDVQKAVKQIACANAEGLELAKDIVRNLFLGMDRGGDLLTVARNLKSHDEYTFTHVLNVSILSMGMAKHLGLTDEGVRLIALGGLFHDVGKERLPSELLNKPGKLTAEERELMNRHPRDGADVLLSLPGDVHPLLPTIAYQHHMGANLSGYPTPRWKIAAHPASRLVAVADVFDALRTIRPYRGALTEVQASNIILQDCQRGMLESACVSALFGLLGLLGVGQRVDLADGGSGTVIAPGGSDRLRPLVETEGGELIDLADPSAHQIAALREEEACAPTSG
jgi:putative nucleotidyltransferase with HDIG domain